MSSQGSLSLCPHSFLQVRPLCSHPKQDWRRHPCLSVAPLLLSPACLSNRRRFKCISADEERLPASPHRGLKFVWKILTSLIAWQSQHSLQQGKKRLTWQPLTAYAGVRQELTDFRAGLPVCVCDVCYHAQLCACQGGCLYSCACICVCILCICVCV